MMFEKVERCEPEYFKAVGRRQLDTLVIQQMMFEKVERCKPEYFKVVGRRQPETLVINV